jgi:hypothetical protein
VTLCVGAGSKPRKLRRYSLGCGRDDLLAHLPRMREGSSRKYGITALQ